MRFVENGPDVPEEVLQAQRKGELLFVVGSGVSKRLGLPLFSELAADVYRALGQPPPGEANSLAEVGEVEAWAASQWDRVLGLLEKRLVYANPNRPTAGNPLRQAVYALLQAKRLKFEVYKHILGISRDELGRPRVVTTNFDTLIERAWRRSQAIPRTSYFGPGLPPVGSPEFYGILHLHGRTNDQSLGLAATNLILTSADFGEAYLRDGWASRYMYDLMRRYTLVFVGYSADDPPMRYMLEATEAGRLKFPDLRRAFAFAEIVDDEGKTFARWRGKGLEAIPFENTNRDYSALYTTIAEWSASVSDPQVWADKQIKRIVTQHYSSTADEAKRKVRFLVSTISDVQTLSKHAVMPDWLEVLAPADGSRVIEPHEARVWLSSRLESLDTVNWIVSKLETGIAQRVAAATDQLLSAPNLKVSDDFRLFWRLLLRSIEASSRQVSNWPIAAQSLKRGQLDFFSCEAIAEIVQPQPRVRNPWPSFSPRDEKTLMRALEDAYRIEFKCESWPTHKEILQHIQADTPIGPLLLCLDRTLSAACALATEAKLISADGDAVSIRVALVHEATKSELAPALAEPLILHGTPNHPDDYDHSFAPIVRLMSALWQRLYAADKVAARNIARGWLAHEALLMRRLGYWAATEDRNLISDAEQRLLTLDRESFWKRELVAESARFWCLSWNKLRPSVRRKLENLIRVGPTLNTTWRPTTHAQRREIVADLTHRELRRIATAKGRLSRNGVRLMRVLETRYPSFVPKEEIYQDLYHVSWSGVGPTGDPASVDEATVDTLIATVDAVVAAQPHEQRDLWQTVCRSRTSDALEALWKATQTGVWPSEKWRDLLTQLNAPQAKLELKRARRTELAVLLAEMPPTTFNATLHSICSWIESAAADATTKRLRAAVLRLWDRVADAVVGQADEARTVFDPDLMTTSLNDPAGHLVETLFVLLRLTPPKKGTGFPNDLHRRFDQLVRFEGLSRQYALVSLVRRVGYLNWLTPEWTERNVFSALDPNTREADALFEALSLYGDYQYDAIFRRLKARIFAAITSRHIADQARDHLAAWVTWITIRRLDGKADIEVTATEVRELLTRAPANTLRSVAWSLWRSLADAKPRAKRRHWERFIAPFLSEVWPNDVSTRDPSISDILSKIPAAGGSAFPEVAKCVGDMLMPFRMHSLLIGLGLDEGGLVERYPESALDFVATAIDLTAPRPYDMDQFLQDILKAKPALKADVRFQRLSAPTHFT